MAARRRVANPTFQDNEIHAKYQDKRRKFHHAIYLNGSRPFKLQEFTLTIGPHAGLKAYVAVPATHFPFERLPLELRQRIYKILFPVKEVVFIDEPSRHDFRVYIDGSWVRLKPRETAILCVNRAINAEAVEFLYRPSEFVSSALTFLNIWLARIGSCRKHLTRLAITKSAPSLLESCYKLLRGAPSLQSLEVALPTDLRATLDESVERHWESLKLYILAPSVNRAEALRRVKTVSFLIRPSQNGIVNSEGDPVKEMTKARQDFCKTKIRGKVLECFMRKTMEKPVKVESIADAEKKTTVQPFKCEKKDDDIRSEAEVQWNLTSKSRPVIVIDDDTDD